MLGSFLQRNRGVGRVGGLSLSQAHPPRRSPCRGAAWGRGKPWQWGGQCFGGHQGSSVWWVVRADGPRGRAAGVRRGVKMFCALSDKCHGPAPEMGQGRM